MPLRTPTYFECAFTVILGLVLTQVEGLGRKFLLVVVLLFFFARTQLVHDFIPASLNIGRDPAETKSARERAIHAKLHRPVIIQGASEDPALDRETNKED